MKQIVINLIRFWFLLVIVLFISVMDSEKTGLTQVPEDDSAYIPESAIILLKSDLEKILQDDLHVKGYGANEEKALLKDIAAAEKSILRTNILIIEQNNKIISLLQELNKK